MNGTKDATYRLKLAQGFIEEARQATNHGFQVPPQGFPPPLPSPQSQAP